ncbi:acyltransferase family protein [Xanthomonas sp.]|uniref:acyltransferase family protein n=1 Tax=Xanthomonas sp. TaxID=29446 RepID=UPI001F13204B|nr:acyltransferase family protein [Xanthomonas sp.]
MGAGTGGTPRPGHGRAGGGYLPYVDGLRALAVLAVIVYHLDPSWLPGGFTGVDVFFVISGFVVSASLQRLPAAGSWRVFVQFYARRLRRIAPALVACLLLTGALSGLFIPESWLSETSAKTGRMAFVGLSNWVLAATGNDYFSPKAEFNPYTHTWSLGVEEQFYLLFPLLFLAWHRGGRGRVLSLALVALGSAASLGYAWMRTRSGTEQVDAFYLTTTRFWQLGLGVLLYQGLELSGRYAPVPVPVPARAWSWRSPLILLALAMVGYGLWRARPGHSPWPDGLWPAVGTLGLLALLHGPAHGWIKRGLSLAPVVAVGRVSYSLYLWHWPVFVLFRWTVGLDSAPSRGVALLLVALLAMASYRFVELPWRHGRALAQRPPGRVVAAGLALVLLSAGVHSLLVKTQRHYSLSVVSRHPLDWYAYAKGLRGDYPNCTLRSSQVQVEVGSAKRFERGECDLRNRDGGQLFVAGDSHALAYNELLRRFAVESGVSVRLYGAGGCAIAGMQAWQAQNPGCQAYHRSSLADVSAHAQPGDVLFLPALRLPRLAEQTELFDEPALMASQYSEQERAVRAATEEATVELLRPLALRGVRIVFEAPKPLLRAPPYRCADWFNRRNAICARGMVTERRFMERYRAPVLQSLQRIAARLPHASVWDPLPSLCDAAACAAMRDGRPLFFDADHLSGYGNRVLLPGFSAHLRAVVAPPSAR